MQALFSLTRTDGALSPNACGVVGAIQMWWLLLSGYYLSCGIAQENSFMLDTSTLMLFALIVLLFDKGITIYATLEDDWAWIWKLQSNCVEIENRGGDGKAIGGADADGDGDDLTTLNGCCGRRRPPFLIWAYGHPFLIWAYGHPFLIWASLPHMGMGVLLSTLLTRQAVGRVALRGHDSDGHA